MEGRANQRTWFGGEDGGSATSIQSQSSISQQIRGGRVMAGRIRELHARRRPRDQYPHLLQMSVSSQLLTASSPSSRSVSSVEHPLISVSSHHHPHNTDSYGAGVEDRAKSLFWIAVSPRSHAFVNGCLKFHNTPVCSLSQSSYCLCIQHLLHTYPVHTPFALSHLPFVPLSPLSYPPFMPLNHARSPHLNKAHKRTKHHAI